VQIEQSEVDGVPVLWADTGSGGFIGALAFGVGRIDESAATAGISHLVEHLALARFGQRDYDANAFVDPVRTVFHAAGTAVEVGEHLAAVARSLRDIPWERVPIERRILRDEAAQSGSSISGALLWYRFGSFGHGLPGVDEHGIGWLGPERIRPWIEARYVRENAVVWLSGPPPAELRLELGAGARPRRPAPTPLPELRYPTHVPWHGPGVAISYLARRTFASNVVAYVLQRRARQQLRFDQGLVYDIAFDYAALDAETAHVTIGADCPDDRIPVVRDALLAVLHELAADGPTDAELAAETATMARGFDERDGRLAFLDIQASEVLFGADVRQPADTMASRGAVTSDEARDALAQSLESLLMLANSPEMPSPWVTYPAWSSSVVRGRELRPAGFHLPGRGAKERLVVADDGVSVVTPGGALTVRWHDLVAVVHEAPTVRRVIGRDGFIVTVAAEAWRDGAQAVAAIDAAAPSDVVACGEHGVGGLEIPDG
jgi:predicted Zn-dependent peptidase